MVQLRPKGWGWAAIGPICDQNLPRPEDQVASSASASSTQASRPPPVTVHIKVKLAEGSEDYFEDDVEWDVNSLHLPEPEAFAASVGHDLGLSHREVTALMQSVTEQLKALAAANPQTLELHYSYQEQTQQETAEAARRVAEEKAMLLAIAKQTQGQWFGRGGNGGGLLGDFSGDLTGEGGGGGGGGSAKKVAAAHEKKPSKKRMMDITLLKDHTDPVIDPLITQLPFQLSLLLEALSKEAQRVVRSFLQHVPYSPLDDHQCHGCKHPQAKTVAYCPRGYHSHALCEFHFGRYHHDMTLEQGIARFEAAGQPRKEKEEEEGGGGGGGKDGKGDTKPPPPPLKEQKKAAAPTPTKPEEKKKGKEEGKSDEETQPLCVVCTLQCSCRACRRVSIRRALDLLRRALNFKAGRPVTEDADLLHLLATQPLALAGTGALTIAHSLLEDDVRRFFMGQSEESRYKTAKILHKHTIPESYLPPLAVTQRLNFPSLVIPALDGPLLETLHSYLQAKDKAFRGEPAPPRAPPQPKLTAEEKKAARIAAKQASRETAKVTRRAARMTKQAARARAHGYVLPANFDPVAYARAGQTSLVNVFPDFPIFEGEQKRRKGGPTVRGGPGAKKRKLDFSLVGDSMTVRLRIRKRPFVPARTSPNMVVKLCKGAKGAWACVIPTPEEEGVVGKKKAARPSAYLPEQRGRYVLEMVYPSELVAPPCTVMLAIHGSSGGGRGKSVFPPPIQTGGGGEWDVPAVGSAASPVATIMPHEDSKLPPSLLAGIESPPKKKSHHKKKPSATAAAPASAKAASPALPPLPTPVPAAVPKEEVPAEPTRLRDPDHLNLELCCICQEDVALDEEAERKKKVPNRLLLCLNCPRAYHSKCLRLTKLPSDCVNWECSDCKLPEDEVTRSVVEELGLEATPERDARMILDFLRKHELSGAFCERIDISIVEDYTQFVRQPTDLTTLWEKYFGAEAVAAAAALAAAQKGAKGKLMAAATFPLVDYICDVRRVWHNCGMYNSKGTIFFAIGDLLSRCFERNVTERLLRYMDEEGMDALEARRKAMRREGRQDLAKLEREGTMPDDYVNGLGLVEDADAGEDEQEEGGGGGGKKAAAPAKKSHKKSKPTSSVEGKKGAASATAATAAAAAAVVAVAPTPSPRLSRGAAASAASTGGSGGGGGGSARPKRGSGK